MNKVIYGWATDLPFEDMVLTLGPQLGPPMASQPGPPGGRRLPGVPRDGPADAGGVGLRRKAGRWEPSYGSRG